MALTRDEIAGILIKRLPNAPICTINTIVDDLCNALDMDCDIVTMPLADPETFARVRNAMSRRAQERSMEPKQVVHDLICMLGQQNRQLRMTEEQRQAAESCVYRMINSGLQIDKFTVNNIAHGNYRRYLDYDGFAELQLILAAC